MLNLKHFPKGIRLSNNRFLDVLKFCGKNHIPFNTVDVQNIVVGTCGWYCLSFLYFISVMPERSGNLYNDAEDWTSLFNDLSKCHDWKHNEYVLKLFFIEFVVLNIFHCIS